MNPVKKIVGVRAASPASAISLYAATALGVTAFGADSTSATDDIG
jgi:hypothetical protein